MPDQLTQPLIQILRDALDQGFLPPLYVAAIGTNGSVMVCQYDAPETAPGLAITILCEHYNDAIFGEPINVMVVDQTGRSFRVATTGSPLHDAR